MKTYTLTNIKYDTGLKKVDGLPETIQVSQYHMDCMIEWFEQDDHYDDLEEFIEETLLEGWGAEIISRETDWLVEDFDLVVSE